MQFLSEIVFQVKKVIYFVTEDKSNYSRGFIVLQKQAFFHRSRGKHILFLFKHEIWQYFSPATNLKTMSQHFQIIRQTSSSQVYKKVNNEVQVILITQPVTIIM